MTEPIKTKIEAIISEYCDEKYNGLEGSYFAHSTNPQELADRIYDLFKEESKENKNETQTPHTPKLGRG